MTRWHKPGRTYRKQSQSRVMKCQFVMRVFTSTTTAMVGRAQCAPLLVGRCWGQHLEQLHLWTVRWTIFMLHVSGTVPQQSIDANYVFLRRLIVVNNRRITSTIDVNNRRKLRFSKLRQQSTQITFFKRREWRDIYWWGVKRWPRSGSPNYGPWAKSGPRSNVIQPLRHFVNIENVIYLRKVCWFGTLQHI